VGKGFPRGFLCVWVWDGYGDCDESPWACGDSMGIFERMQDKRKCVKHTINFAVDVCISLNAVQFLICFTGIFMAALRSRYGHYIFALWFLCIFYFSPNLSRCRLDVYHTSAHDVALVRI